MSVCTYCWQGLEYVDCLSSRGVRYPQNGASAAQLVIKGRVVCETVYVDMHYKDLLGSIVRVGYCIPVLDFYLVLHGLRRRKSIIMDTQTTDTTNKQTTCSAIKASWMMSDHII